MVQLRAFFCWILFGLQLHQPFTKGRPSSLWYDITAELFLWRAKMGCFRCGVSAVFSQCFMSDSYTGFRQQWPAGQPSQVSYDWPGTWQRKNAERFCYCTVSPRSRLVKDGFHPLFGLKMLLRNTVFSLIWCGFLGIFSHVLSIC